MTRADSARRWKAMQDFRAAIKGWAFAAPDKLPSYLAQGEEEACRLLDPGDRAAAEKDLDALREAVGRQGS